MARTFARILAFMLAVVGIYAYIGQLMPQFEEHPPRKRLITVQTPPDELVAIGQELTRGKGGCLVCHKDAEPGNVRGPALRQHDGGGLDLRARHVRRTAPRRALSIPA